MQIRVVLLLVFVLGALTLAIALTAMSLLLVRGFNEPEESAQRQ